MQLLLNGGTLLFGRSLQDHVICIRHILTKSSMSLTFIFKTKLLKFHSFLLPNKCVGRFGMPKRSQQTSQFDSHLRAWVLMSVNTNDEI